MDETFSNDTFSFDDYFNALITPTEQKEIKTEQPQAIPMQQVKIIIPTANPNLSKEVREIKKPLTGNNAGAAPTNVHRKKRRSSGSGEDYSPNHSDEQTEESQEKRSKKKKKKKEKKIKKKQHKETSKRKRVNYCFEIHRSGCQDNKNSKLYCKVFLKGKLQAEVDLIKGARGKYAYTFYDQRKEKNERRYWPSQSSGPIIEDPCNCEKCVTTIRESNEVDFSPSTEDHTLVEAETNVPKQTNPENNNSPFIEEEYVNNSHSYQQPPQQQETQELPPESQLIQLGETLQPIPVVGIALDNSIDYQPRFQHLLNPSENSQTTYISMQPPNEFSRNQYVLKSSTDYQDNRNNHFDFQPHYNQYVLKSSNDFQNAQRNWNEILPNQNNTQYEYTGGDGFFVESPFL